MNDVLNKTTVLVLNRNWQAIHVKTPAQAFCMMATGVATALDIQENGDMHPVKWGTGSRCGAGSNRGRSRDVREGAQTPSEILGETALGTRRRHLPVHRTQARSGR